MKPLPSIAKGVYRHYKGGLYEVLDVARHSESQEVLVVYRPLYGERECWVRPYAMFMEQVQLEGVMQPRFAPVPAASPKPETSAVQPPQQAAEAVRLSDAELEERAQAILAGATDKPDFSSLPVFENARQAWLLAGAAVLVLGLLIFVFS